MNFLLPAAFGLLALMPVVIALYLLKRRRIEQPVSSLYLWRKMVQDREASAPWQKLRFNWLLILQLIFMALLILALARPFVWREGISGQSAIIILDSSASMAARDVEPSRFEAARQRARELINALPENTRLTIIEAGSEPQVPVTSSLDRARALQALDSIRQSGGSADLAMALELASAIASRHADTQIILLSDGGADFPEHLVLHGQLKYLPVGLHGHNQAISLINIETAQAGGWSLFIQVTNYDEVQASRRLNVYADEVLIDVQEIDLPAKEEQPVLIDDIPGEVKHIRVELEGEDDLQLDDQAFLVVRETKPRQVTLVSSGNLFLKTALRLLPGIELTEVSPTEGQPGNADVVVLDRVVPDVLPEQGSLWFIAPPVSSQLFNLNGEITAPVMRFLDADDFFVSDISLADVHLLDSKWVELPLWGVPVIAGDSESISAPLLFRGEPEGRRVVVMAFDLSHSDLPLNVAFPVLSANIMNWLAPGAAQDIPGSVMPGDTLELPEEVDQLTLIYPDGSREKLEPQGNRLALNGLEQPGFYQLLLEDQAPIELAVNMYSARESDITPLDRLPDLLSDDASAESESRQARKETWRWLAVPALLILMLEWMWFYKGGLMRLRDVMISVSTALRARLLLK